MEKKGWRKWLAKERDWNKWINTAIWAGILFTLIKISISLSYMVDSLRWLVKPILNDWGPWGY